MRVPITVYGSFPACESETCTLLKHCANHVSAGDYRSEWGIRPVLESLDLGEGEGTGTVDCHTHNITVPLDNFDVDDPEKVSYGEFVPIHEISTQRLLF